MSFRGNPRNLINNKINKIRFLTFVRNDNIPYYDTVSQGGGDFLQVFDTPQLCCGVIWFGFLGLFVCVTLVTGVVKSNLGILFVLVPAFMAATGYFIMKKLVFDLIDEVYDEGETLLFREKGKEVRVSLGDIKNVSYSPMVNPPRVTLTIRYTTELGDELSFSPPASFIPFRKNRDIEELIDRIDRAGG